MSTANQTEQVVATEPVEKQEKSKEQILAELQAHVSSFRNRLEDIFTNNDLKDQTDQEIAEELKHVFRAQLNDALLYLIAEDKTSWRGTLAQLLDSQISSFRSKQQRSDEAVMILDSNLTGITDLQYLIQRLLGDGLLFQLDSNHELAELLTTMELTPEKLAVAPAYINHYAGPKIQTETEQYEFHSRQIVVLREVCSVMEQYQSAYESIIAAPLISEEERKAFLFALLVPGEQIGTNYPKVWLYKYWPDEFFQYYYANPWLKEIASELFPDRAGDFNPPTEQQQSKSD